MQKGHVRASELPICTGSLDEIIGYTDRGGGGGGVGRFSTCTEYEPLRGPVVSAHTRDQTQPMSVQPRSTLSAMIAPIDDRLRASATNDSCTPPAAENVAEMLTHGPGDGHFGSLGPLWARLEHDPVLVSSPSQTTHERTL